MYRLLAYIALLLVSPQVFGGVFDPPPTDKSVELLGIIFGATVGDIYLGGATNSALSEIMEKFNFIIVTAGLIVVSYAGIMSTINTAQEGTVMGKKWSAIWVPMRSIIGMLLMVPSPGTGYSMIQVTVMWIVLQGVGAADQLWTILLENLAVGNSASMGTKALDPGKALPIATNGEELAKQLLAHAICLEIYHLASKLPVGPTPPLATVDKIGNLAWLAQTDHQGAGDWVANNGSKVKFYREQTQDATISNSVLSGPTGPNNNDFPATKGADAKGRAMFGDSTDNSEYAQVCGRVDVTGTVWYNDFLNADINNWEDNIPGENEVKKAAQNMYDIKQQAISTMLTTLQPLAEEIVNGDITPNDPGAAKVYLDNAKEAYIALLSGLSVPVETGDVNRTMIDLGIQDGWITAGSYYFTFNKVLTSETFYDVINKVNNVSLEACLECDPPSYASCLPTKLAGDGSCASENFLKGFKRYDFELAKYLQDQTALIIRNMNANSNIIDVKHGESAGEVLGLIAVGNTQVMEGLANLLEGDGGEPLLAHAAFGRSMMIAAEVLWFIIVGLTIGVSVATGFIPFVSAGAAITLSFVSTVFAMVIPLLGMMWTMGATLAIYLPFIPYMIFTVTALGWLLTVVESVIAAPLIALGLVIPAGDEMGKLSTALMLLANIFLRPMLMIFGFILAANVYKAAITLVDYGMSVVIAEVNANTAFSWVAIIVVYVSFILSLANTSFSLIYAVPDKILRWLGHSGEGTNMDAMNKAEGMSKGGISHMGGEIGKSGMAAGGKMSKSADGAANNLAAGVASGAKSKDHQKGIDRFLGGDASKGRGKTPPPTE